MRPKRNALASVAFRVTAILSCLAGLRSALGQNYLTPNDVALHTEQASAEALRQSAGKTTLRALGMDVFPRFSFDATYDDNLLITATNQLSDVEWTISPGFTMAAGDVSLYFPGSVTLNQIRNLLNYSLLDDASKPERFVGMDYTPSLNFFTDHSHFDNVDHTAAFSAGYDFARLITGIDADYLRAAVKDNSVGDRVTREMVTAQWRNRYEWTDRSALEISCRYNRLAYENMTYQGYDEFRNEDWFSRKMGARFETGVGAAFGFVYPQFSSDQTYEQAFVRAIYRLTGKLHVRARAGAEWRQYGRGQGDTLDPAFDIEAIYQPRTSTTFTLAGHQRSAPSFGADYNYQIYGFAAGVAQQLSSSLDAELTLNYEHVDYVRLSSIAGEDRADDTFGVRVALGYEFSAHLRATVFYNRNQDDSSVARYSFDNNTVGFRFSWRY